jgi:hypothetical protein
LCVNKNFKLNEKKYNELIKRRFANINLYFKQLFVNNILVRNHKKKTFLQKEDMDALKSKLLEEKERALEHLKNRLIKVS